MKQSMRTRLVVLTALMIILCIAICWIMNLFLLPGFYENSKKNQMNEVYSEVAAQFVIHNQPIPELKPAPLTEVEINIGKRKRNYVRFP